MVTEHFIPEPSTRPDVPRVGTARDARDADLLRWFVIYQGVHSATMHILPAPLGCAIEYSIAGVRDKTRVEGADLYDAIERMKQRETPGT